MSEVKFSSGRIVSLDCSSCGSVADDADCAGDVCRVCGESALRHRLFAKGATESRDLALSEVERVLERELRIEHIAAMMGSSATFSLDPPEAHLAAMEEWLHRPATKTPAAPFTSPAELLTLARPSSGPHSARPLTTPVAATLAPPAVLHALPKRPARSVGTLVVLAGASALFLAAAISGALWLYTPSVERAREAGASPMGAKSQVAAAPSQPVSQDTIKASEGSHPGPVFGRDTSKGGDAVGILGRLVGSEIGERQLVGRRNPQRSKVSSVILGEANLRGSLDKEIIRRIISRHIAEVRYCYETELTKRPNLSGRVSVQFTIAATGEVIASVLQSSTMGNIRVENCLVQAVRRWEFPKPMGGGIVIVSYPFNFTVAGSSE